MHVRERSRRYQSPVFESGRFFLSSHATSDVHFRGPHYTLETGKRRNKRHHLSCAVAQERRGNLKSSQRKNYNHARDVAVVDKSYRRNSCLIPRHMTEMQSAQRK